MPRPTSATTLARPDLGAIAFEYAMEASQRGFIGQQIMPIFEVSEQSGEYPVIPIESLLKLQDTARAPRGNYNRSDYEFETGNYSCKENGWEELLDDVEASLYQRYFDGEEIAVKRAVDIILRVQENRYASKLFNSSNLTVGNVAIEWSTAATAIPRANVTAARQAMRAASGLEPNTGVCSIVVIDNLINTAEVKDAFKYTDPIEIGGREAQAKIIAQYFGLDRVLIGGAIKDTAKKGQDFSLSDIWDDEYFGLFKVTDNPMDLRDPSIGRTFLWTEDSPENLVIESYRDDPRRSEVFRARQNTDEAFVFTGAGYLMGNITA